MKSPTTYNELFNSVRDTIPYKVENELVQFTEQVTDRLAVLKLSRSEFAKRLNASPSYVTKLLSGGTNCTLESMVKVAVALGAELKIQITPKDSPGNWIEKMEKVGQSERAQGMWADWQRRNQTGKNCNLAGPKLLSEENVEHEFYEY